MTTHVTPLPPTVRDPWVEDCRHCGAPTDEPCRPSCPSVDALQLVDELPAEPLAELQPRCCPNPAAAAAVLCWCFGGAA
ncbi:hypothetical protein [Microcystis phage MinS1]|nr:hypothetical protein [Microcystis phage MinS1]